MDAYGGPFRGGGIMMAGTGVETLAQPGGAGGTGRDGRLVGVSQAQGRVGRRQARGGIARERCLELVNASHPLRARPMLQLADIGNGVRLDAQAAGPARRMLEACRAAGLDPKVTSGYRGRLEQTYLLARKTLSLMARGRPPWRAFELARRFVALPGTSEHELGLAIDVCSERGGLRAHAEVQAWLAGHGWRFGFIRRYPAEKSQVTGIACEPWHFRYVGLDAARAMRATGQCLEEFLDAAGSGCQAASPLATSEH